MRQFTVANPRIWIPVHVSPKLPRRTEGCPLCVASCPKHANHTPTTTPTGTVPSHQRGLSLTPTGTVPQAIPIAPNDFPASPLSFGDCPLAVKSLQAVVTCRLGRTVGQHRCPLWLSRAKGIRRCRPASLILSRVVSHLLPSDVAAPGRLRRFTAGGAIPWTASGCKRHRRLPRPCQAPYRPATGHRKPT